MTGTTLTIDVVIQKTYYVTKIKGVNNTMTKKMYVVYKTHLDIGFTDLAKNVIDNYVNDFIPRGIQLGKERPDKFVWTTGSWLIDYYLKQPDIPEVRKEELREALRQGTIKWHGLAHTTWTELMDQRLFNYSLSLSHNLDRAFGKQTIAAKMTDVPGHTIAIVPLMAQAGLKYLHLGVNASSAIPDVPEMFLWRAKDGSEMIVHYAKDYGDLFVREGWDEMLYFAHSHDNQGPPKSVEEIDAIFEKLTVQFPGVEILPSSLDDFAAYAWSKKDTLPVVEEEIADSWIHGIGTDPYKISQLRQLYRLRDQWLASGELTVESPEYQAFSDQLLMVVEHTWGGNGNVFLPDYRSYLIDDFNQSRAASTITFAEAGKYLDFADSMALISTDTKSKEMLPKRSYHLYEESWKEQRAYIENALQTLSSGRKAQALNAFEQMNQAIATLPVSEALKVGYVYELSDSVALSIGTNGSIDYLEVNGRKLVSNHKEFGGLSYERFDFGNYQKYLSQYSRLNQNTATWALVDFNKRGIEAYQSIRYELIKPMVEAGSITQVNGKVEITVDVVYRPFDVENWGLPVKNRLTYVIDPVNGTIDGTYRWEGKQANRMPEGYWLETSLKVNTPSRWKMHKLSDAISPYDVVVKGNRNLHGLSFEGLTYSGADGRVQIQSETAPLISMGRRGLLKFDQEQPSLNEGIFINLYNNVWGTNFPDWFEDDMTFRFSANFEIY